MKATPYTIPGGHLYLKWVRMYVKKIEYKGMFLNSDQVTRVTQLGYGIRPKLAKGGCFFQKWSWKGYISEDFDQNHIKRGTFWAVGTWKGYHFHPCHNSKRVLFWKPFSHMGTHLDTKWPPRGASLSSSGRDSYIYPYDAIGYSVPGAKLCPAALKHAGSWHPPALG
jgi:hypothetical protein